MSLLDRRRLPLAFVEDVSAPLLAGADEHHLRKSLRLRNGAKLTVSDGRGTYRFVALGALSGAPLELLSDCIVEPRKEPLLCVGFTPVKAQKAEWIVQKLTELGVDQIQPLLSDRAVIRWNGKKQAAMSERFAVAAREASMQCRRVWLPSIEPLRSVSEVADSVGPNAPVVLADPGGGRLESAHAMILVGPEGGWSDREATSASLVQLPGNVLRAETAAVVAGAMLWNLRNESDHN